MLKKQQTFEPVDDRPCKHCGEPMIVHSDKDRSVYCDTCAVLIRRAEAAEVALIELKRDIAALANELDEEADRFKVLKENALNNPDSVVFTQLDQKFRVTRGIAHQVRALLDGS